MKDTRSNMKRNLLIFVFLLILVVVSIYIVWPLFQGEYDKNTASIGIAHTIYALFFKRFGWYTWNPFWYGGFPQHLVYPILGPVIFSLTSNVFQISTAGAYRLLEGIAYVLMPVGVFFLTKRLTKNSLAPFFASLIFAFAPSANYFLIPTFLKIGQGNHFVPWQLSILLDYGEGAHFLSLPLIPLAVISYLDLLKNPSNRKLLVLTSLITALIVLLNLFSAYSLIFFFLVVFFSEAALGNVAQKVKISLFLGLTIYGLIAFGYDLTMIKAIASTGYIHPENIFHLPGPTNLALGLIILLPISLVVFEILKNKAHLQKYVLLSGWFLIFFLIPYLFYKFDYWFGSQPNRYMPELNMVSAVIGGIFIIALIDKIKSFFPARIGFFAGLILSTVFIFLIYLSARPYISSSRKFVEANKDIKQTAEFKIAKWLGENTDKKKGERVYLTGSPAFFANAFSDVLQIRGAADNGQPNPWWADVSYQLNKGEDEKLASDWLSAYGVRYIVVEGPTAITPYRDFADPQKFEKIFGVAKEIDGFRIYETQNTADMFVLVNSQELMDSSKIENVLDEENLKKFNEAIRKEKEINFDYKWWEEPDKAKILVSQAEESDGIFFRTTYDSGWKAKVDGKRLEIKKAGPDMMLILPRKAGDYEISLSWHPPKSIYLGWGITILTLIGCIWLVSSSRKLI